MRVLVWSVHIYWVKLKDGIIQIEILIEPEKYQHQEKEEEEGPKKRRMAKSRELGKKNVFNIIILETKGRFIQTILSKRLNSSGGGMFSTYVESTNVYYRIWYVKSTQ